MYPIDFFWRAAHRYPDRPAIIHGARTITFGELSERVASAAALLMERAPHGRSYICVGAANSVDHLIAILAVLAADKIWVPLNPRNGDPELRRIIDFVDPSLVVLDGPMQNRLSSAAGRMLDIAELVAATALPDGLRRTSVVPPLNATQAVKFTGGTTGFPKGVMQPLRAWNTNIVTQIHELGLGQHDRYLVVAPLTHGTSTYMLPILGSGGALIFPVESDPGGLLDAAESNDASIFFAPPTLILVLAAEQDRRPRALRSLRYVVYGGAPMRPEHILQAQASFGEVICTTYGQTEAPQIITFLSPSDITGKNASVGRPTLLTQVGILSRDGHLLPPGEEGEIAVRGDLVMTGYLKAEAETRKTLVDGWLRTGDLGALDEGRYLFIKDRIRDVIITGGFNVYPSDVEVVMLRHAAIAECSIVGVPDEKWGEAVHAAVQIRPGSRLNSEEIVSIVKQELGSVKAPKEIHLFDALPRSPVGKVLKAAIREEILRRRARDSVQGGVSTRP